MFGPQLDLSQGFNLRQQFGELDNLLHCGL
jgi:hypothetical protein